MAIKIKTKREKPEVLLKKIECGTHLKWRCEKRGVDITRKTVLL